jgi:hypothetical protein
MGCLMKMISKTDELVLPLRDFPPEAKEVSIILTDKAGGRAMLKITAHNSIPIQHFKQVLNYEEDAIYKTLSVGEELLFDLRNARHDGSIFLYLIERMRGKAVFKITVEREITVHHVKQQIIGQ